MKQPYRQAARVAARVPMILVLATASLSACGEEAEPIGDGQSLAAMSAPSPTPAQPGPTQPGPTPPVPTQTGPTQTGPTPPQPTPPQPTQPEPSDKQPPTMAMTGEPTFTAIYTEILTNGMTGNCMASFCHGATASASNGQLEIAIGDKDTTYNRLVNAMSTSEMCSGQTLVVPNDSANSLLVQKLGENPPCGMRMPVGVPLSDAQIAQITTWIDMGAPNN